MAILCAPRIVVGYLMSAFTPAFSYGPGDRYFFYQKAFDDLALNPDGDNLLCTVYVRDDVYRQVNFGQRNGTCHSCARARGVRHHAAITNSRRHLSTDGRIYASAFSIDSDGGFALPARRAFHRQDISVTLSVRGPLARCALMSKNRKTRPPLLPRLKRRVSANVILISRANAPTTFPSDCPVGGARGFLEIAASSPTDSGRVRFPSRKSTDTRFPSIRRVPPRWLPQAPRDQQNGH